MTVTINGSSPSLAQKRDMSASFGMPVKIAEVVVGSAQQDIDFTGLDLDTDRVYIIELVMKPNATTDSTVYLYYNADTTAANYQVQYSSAIGASITTQFITSNAAIAFGNITANTAHTYTASLRISKIAGCTPMAHGNSEYTASGNPMHNILNHRWTGTANVTSMKLRHTSNFGAGTVARLYIC